jgi:hypothetical protein
LSIVSYLFYRVIRSEERCDKATKSESLHYSGMPGHAGVMRVLKPRAAVGGRAASFAMAPETHRPICMPLNMKLPLTVGCVCAGAEVASGVGVAFTTGADG